MLCLSTFIRGGAKRHPNIYKIPGVEVGMKERIDGVLGAEYMGFWEQTYICRGAKPPSEVLWT